MRTKKEVCSGEQVMQGFVNCDADRQIPSILSYIDGEEYHGTQAKAQLIRNSKNTVAYFRDYLGKEYGAVDMDKDVLKLIIATASTR